MAGEAGWVGWENAPQRYKGAGGIQNFDVWDQWEMDPYTATACKHLLRWDKKGFPLQDLKKSLHYVEEALVRHDAGVWDKRPPAQPTLTPRQVIDAFGLSGHVALAVEYLLEWRTREIPSEAESALVACQLNIELAIKKQEAQEASCTSS